MACISQECNVYKLFNNLWPITYNLPMKITHKYAINSNYIIHIYIFKLPAFKFPINTWQIFTKPIILSLFHTFIFHQHVQLSSLCYIPAAICLLIFSMSCLSRNFCRENTIPYVTMLKTRVMLSNIQNFLSSSSGDGKQLKCNENYVAQIYVMI